MPKGKRNTPQRERYNAILIEDLKSEFRAVTEGMQTAKEEIIAEMDRRFEGTNQRLDNVELVLQQHSQILQEHSRKLDTVERVLQQHSQSLQRLETKVDKFAESVRQHDDEIRQIKVGRGG